MISKLYHMGELVINSHDAHTDSSNERRRHIVMPAVIPRMIIRIYLKYDILTYPYDINIIYTNPYGRFVNASV